MFLSVYEKLLMVKTSMSIGSPFDIVNDQDTDPHYALPVGAGVLITVF